MSRFTVLFTCLAAALAAQPVAADPSPQPGSRRPVVAIVDSGIARTPELSPWLVAEYDAAAPAPRPAFAPRYDHGTMVATILLRAARQPVDIVSIRIDDPAGCPKGQNPPCQPSAERVAAAIRKATSLGVDAINLSLALADDPGIVDAVRDAAAHHIQVVLAAGNQGLDHPANLGAAVAGFPNTVLVGAVDARGRVWSGSNRPGHPDGRYDYAWQQGVAVPTVTASGRSTLGTGTSFAAPIETARRIAGLAPAPEPQTIALAQLAPTS